VADFVADFVAENKKAPENQRPILFVSGPDETFLKTDLQLLMGFGRKWVEIWALFDLFHLF
jgi:hypothetical protein